MNEEFIEKTQGVSNPYPQLLVGCPVQRREWIIDRWWDHTVTAALATGLDFAFIFVIDKNDPTFSRLNDLSDRDKIPVFFVCIEEDGREDKRDWAEVRLRKMVSLRNLLLKWVRKIGPNLFLSLDSDMLLEEVGIKVLVEKTDEWDAVGGKAFLTSSGDNNPTFGIWKGDPENGRYTRGNRDYTCKVDVLMAIKLMTPAAYNVDYEFARQGEDIGWSLNCWRQGLEFGWVGEVTNRHIMGREFLDKKDIRIDRDGL